MLITLHEGSSSIKAEKLTPAIQPVAGHKT
jgi:hypothetical protein